MDPERLARIVAQNAESARLLGVDFVPIYRRQGAEDQDHSDLARGAGLMSPEDEADPPTVEVVQRGGPAPPPSPSLASSPSTPPPAPRGASAAASAPAGRAAPVFDTSPVQRTPEAVQAALDAIRVRYEQDCPHQHFITAHTNLVFGEGNPLARLMFIGEAPGAEEDKCGRPFVGRAGQLLNKMITAMGLSREEVYISNILKTRPPDNATPTSEEIRLCAPYLYQQIAVLQPEVIVTLGLPATRALLNTMDPMSRLRGRWHAFRAPLPAGSDVAVMPTYHPAFLLRAYTPENRTKVWSDLLQVIERLGLKKPR